jgi:tRNA A-37 threonylcarbamoyl transferase component Bud32
MAEPNLVGANLEGRFQITAVLGEGAMGKVYLAEHPVLRRQYAIKVLKETAAANKNLAERFRREAKIASRLDHPNIVVITDFGTMENGQLYLIMEYIDGESLRELLERTSPSRLPMTRSLELIRQLSGAIDAAHRASIIHRDIKPDNILLGKNRSGGDLVKILDFGLAKIVEGTDMPKLTKAGDIFGSPYYMSPEQCIGSPSDHRADIYALGVVAFELLVGRVPFEAKSIPRMIKAHLQDPPPRPSSLLPAGEEPLPAQLEEFVLRCLAKKREDRPQSAAEFKELVEDYQEKNREATEAAAVHRPAGAISAAMAQVQPAFEQAVRASQDALAAQPAPPAPVPAPATPDGPSLLGGEADAEARKGWHWNRICKIAMDLTQRLKRHRFANEELMTVFAKASELEEKELFLQTDVAIQVSEMEDLDEQVREPTAQLRHAIVDLRVERDSIFEQEKPDFLKMADLEFQLNQLEIRLADTYADTEKKQRGYATSLNSMREELDAHQAELLDLERRLISHLQAANPKAPPPGIAKKYAELDDALAKLFALHH